MCAKQIAKPGAAAALSDPLVEKLGTQKPDKSANPLVHSKNGLSPASPRGASTLAVHAGEDRAENRQLDHRSDLRRLDLHLCRHAVGHRLHRAEAAARRIRPLRQPERKGRRAQAGGAGRGRSRAAVFQRHVGDRRCCCLPSSTPATKSSSSTSVTTAAASSARKHLSRFGVVTRQVPACDYDAMEAAITPRTKLLISESPTNPHLSVVDLERFADIGRRHGVETLIDATLGTPYNIRPLAAGIDYVLHSATKYLGGHNDLLAGVLIGTHRKAGAGPQAARHHGGHQLAAQYLSAGARPENVRTADAAAQRKRPGRGRVSGRAIRGSKRSTIPACRRIRITKWPSARCAASAAW